MEMQSDNKQNQIDVQKLDIGLLNQKYKPLSPKERVKLFYSEFSNILFTSSFGTTAIHLLHMMHELGIKQKVHFINTTFHFEETLQYKEKIKHLLNLEIVDIYPDEKQNNFSKLAELWKYDPDECCKINKINPFEPVKNQYNIWISGLMGWQSKFRKTLDIFELKNGILKFYPLIDVEEHEVREYFKKHNLPDHPLYKHGYESIGCMHCTKMGEKREGRWPQKVKTECGLHL